MGRKQKSFLVLIDCCSDKTGKSFKSGDVISGTEFPSQVIEHWLLKGVLRVIEQEDSDDNREY